MSENSSELKELGNNLLRSKQYSKAVEAYSRSLAIEPSAPVFCNRSVAYRNLGMLSEALADTDNALNIDPSFHKAFLRKAQVYEARNLDQKALSEYRKLFSAEPSAEHAKLLCKSTEKFPDILAQAEGFKQTGNSAYGRKDYETAVRDFTKSIELYPAPSIYSNRSAAHYELGNTEAAVEDATIALTMDPKFSKAYRRRAAAFEKMGKYEDAGYDYNVLSTLEPQNRNKYLSMQQNCNSKQKKKDKIDPYTILELESYRGKDIPESVLNKAYRKIAAKWHTDRFVNKSNEEIEQAAEMYRKVGEAKDILSDRRRKMAFDQGIDDSEPGAGFGGFGGFGGFPEGMSFGGFDPSILFNMGFGGGNGARSFHFSSGDFNF